MAALKPKRIVLALCLALLADIATSLFLIRDGVFFNRPLPPFGARTHPNQLATLEKMGAEPAGNWAFDRELGWNWRPSSVSEDGRYRINALGARGPREYGPAPLAGTRRVLTFGDSFTFCDEVGAEDSFQAQLEALESGLEVLNFGVSGYGTDQAWLRYRRVGRGLGAEVVCIGLMLENIGRNVNRYRPLWATRTGVCVTKPRFVLDAGGAPVLVPQPYATRAELLAAILDGSVLEHVAEHEYWLGRPTVPSGKLSAFVRLSAGYLAYRERTPARLWREPAGEPFRVTLALLEHFQREVLADGARLAPVLVFPAKEDLTRYALTGRPYWLELYAELERRGLPFLDLIEPLVERARAEPGEHGVQRLYEGGHLSALGNAVVARALGEWLRAHGAGAPEER
ncbi:MAG: SGNH/GDSL hydrolase family protein [Planctomycetes bacterium]|nr:SGNH/GDSL hydrolase family protein [Planctomycetota bacterium]